MITVDHLFDLESALDELTDFWMGEGLTYKQATLLGLYQVTAGALFGDPKAPPPPRPEA